MIPFRVLRLLEFKPFLSLRAYRNRRVVATRYSCALSCSVSLMLRIVYGVGSPHVWLVLVSLIVEKSHTVHRGECAYQTASAIYTLAARPWVSPGCMAPSDANATEHRIAVITNRYVHLRWAPMLVAVKDVLQEAVTLHTRITPLVK